MVIPASALGEGTGLVRSIRWSPSEERGGEVKLRGPSRAEWGAVGLSVSERFSQPSGSDAFGQIAQS